MRKFTNNAVQSLTFAALALTIGALPTAHAAESYWSAVVANRLAAGSDAAGVSLTLGTKGGGITMPENNSIVKIKDRNGGDSVALARGADPGAVWTRLGNSGGLDVTAEPPPAPVGGFADGSFADVRWNYQYADTPLVKSGTWQDNVNANLGALTVIAAGGKIDKDTFQKAALDLVNDGATAVVFTNIRVYTNQSLLNFDIDDFTNATGDPLLVNPVAVGPGSEVSLSLDRYVSDGTYQLLCAQVYTTDNPSEVLDIASAVVPEPASLALLLTGALTFVRVRRRF